VDDERWSLLRGNAFSNSSSNGALLSGPVAYLLAVQLFGSHTAIHDRAASIAAGHLDPR
jgi:hypothetical protein